MTQIPCIPSENFNPRSREGSDMGSQQTYETVLYFNPRSREGSDTVVGHMVDGGVISIHAPARGATNTLTQHVFVRIISIHAPARGATYMVSLDLLHLADFNPRSREGSDMPTQPPFSAHGSFQSTLPRGERLLITSTFDSKALFQSTLPRGERPFSLLSLSSLLLFQSTLPRGERLNHSIQNHYATQFQSTLPRGERRVSVKSDFSIVRFQSTLPRGERRSSSAGSADTASISIHAPARGATQSGCGSSMPCSYFNPRSREGSDRKYYLFLLCQRFLLKQYSQITIFSNYTNIKSLILICHFPGANLSGISC